LPALIIILNITIGLWVAYALLVLYYWYSWQTVPLFTASGEIQQTTVSVIIPARNEEENIGQLLQALQQQTYPAALTGIIVVDDHSTDQTAAIVKQFPSVQLLQLSDEGINSYKKKAIEKGIAAAKGQLIITTDADCLPGEQWLETILDFQTKNKSAFIAAPVVIDCNSSVVQVFQAMDFMVLQGITGAVVHNRQLSMCNGANLAYEKKVFEQVNGFSGIDHIASGDDMLLMHKIGKQFPGRVHYLKSAEAMVHTKPVSSWSAFFQQRIRWASKAGKYDDKGIFGVLLLVYAFNLGFLALLIGAIWHPVLLLWFIGLLAAKTIVELPLFVSVAKFFHKEWAIKWFFFFQPLHIFYTILSGLLGQFGKYEWKGRRVQ
jgi:biofilm PGA synthesis N-glycosyltransferase PgaC